MEVVGPWQLWVISRTAQFFILRLAGVLGGALPNQDPLPLGFPRMGGRSFFGGGGAGGRFLGRAC